MPDRGTSSRTISIGASTPSPCGSRGAKSNTSNTPSAADTVVRSTLVLATYCITNDGSAPVGTKPNRPPLLAVEQRGEDRGAVEARQAQPLDVRGRRHQRQHAPVPDRAVIERGNESRHRPADRAQLRVILMLVDGDVLHRPILPAGRRAADAAHDVHAGGHLAEHRVAVVEVRRRAERDEELAAVGVGPAVGHRQDAGLVVPEPRVELVGELVAGAADALSQRIAALDHEAVDHAVEDDAVVVRRPSSSPGCRDASIPWCLRPARRSWPRCWAPLRRRVVPVKLPSLVTNSACTATRCPPGPQYVRSLQCH